MNITDATKELDEAIGDGVKTLAALRTIRAELGSHAALREEIDALQRRYEAMLNKQDHTSLALWRAEMQAQTVAADHEREVRGLKHQLASAEKTIERVSERRDFWHNRAQNDGREHAKALDRLAKTDGVLMELCQLLGLDPTGDVVAEMKARRTAAEPEPTPATWPISPFVPTTVEVRMNDLPECCKCTPNAERAETLYCAYQRGGPDDRASLAWDGWLRPTWAQLLERAEGGDVGATGVVDKWRAVAKNVDEGMAAMSENGLIRAIATAEPASRMFHVKQSGFQDLGKMLGYVDSLGNFHADNGALYGCIYSAVPVEPPKPKDPSALPKLEAGACVARRVRINLVTPDGIILFDDGTWTNPLQWTLANFLPDEPHEDIPF